MGSGPTQREIARELKLTPGRVTRAIERLSGVRRIAHRPKESRALFIVDAPVAPPRAKPAAAAGELRRVTIWGEIQAGEPIEPIIDSPETIDVPASWLRPGQSYYALRVRGDSMRDALIASGDVVIIQRDAEIRDGAKAVCLLPDGSATLKHAFREGKGWRLEPANPDYQPIKVASCRFQGKVVSVVRSFG